MSLVYCCLAQKTDRSAIRIIRNRTSHESSKHGETNPHSDNVWAFSLFSPQVLLGHCMCGGLLGVTPPNILSKSRLSHFVNGLLTLQFIFSLWTTTADGGWIPRTEPPLFSITTRESPNSFLNIRSPCFQKKENHFSAADHPTNVLRIIILF